MPGILDIVIMCVVSFALLLGATIALSSAVLVAKLFAFGIISTAASVAVYNIAIYISDNIAV